MRTPTAHLATLRRLRHGLAVKLDRRLALGGTVSAFEAQRNADEVESLGWAISTLGRLLRKARARRVGREAAPPGVGA